jgi:hypothetical protein
MLADADPAPIELIMTPFDQPLVRDHRRRLPTSASGQVLELGGAGGADLAYDGCEVAEIVLAGSQPGAASALPVPRDDSCSSIPAPDQEGAGLRRGESA